ncbi:trna delta -isopentenylpyrophosphate transferase [Microvirga mediterraneensis]|uniref:trna delta -isopentenylpyrophosphate transferase n=1 Tax=Microvirga mediterraneensis TaxID=2754695 RepID=UPI001FE85466|nr:trna delta -isopentenylpyrophosphate transferase [Microvirga mediterraneensis]
MNHKDKKIAETLAKFGEPMGDNIWRVQGTAVIYHKTLERIAAQAKIQFDVPTVLRAEKEEAVLMVVGRMGDRLEWSIGEATIGMNYRVSGKQAAYPYAMAEKRAKDRVILKLIELSGDVYSEEEADEFKESRPDRGQSQQRQEQRQSTKVSEADIIAEFRKAGSVESLKGVYATAKQYIDLMNEKAVDEVRTAYTERLHELREAA